MQILALISKNLEKASTCYRFTQYLPWFNDHGIDVELVTRDSLNNDTIRKAGEVDLVLNLKCRINQGMSRKIIEAARRVIFDFDDAIYTRPGKPHSLITAYRVRKRLHFWLKNADVVTVPNGILADYARKHASKVEIVPMSLDLDKWKPVDKPESETLTIGWAGSPSTLYNLERIGPILEDILKKQGKVRLAVYSGEKPQFTFPFHFQPYISGTEIPFLQTLDVGLLPLHYDTFALGKSPIKAVQYLACGIPVIGNIQGGTAEILDRENSIAVDNAGEWSEAVAKLVDDRKLRLEMGAKGRASALGKHEIRCVASQLVKLFKEEDI